MNDDYLLYAFNALKAALDKREDAPASSAEHERMAFLALARSAVPKPQEVQHSWKERICETFGPDGDGPPIAAAEPPREQPADIERLATTTVERIAAIVDSPPFAQVDLNAVERIVLEALESAARLTQERTP